MHDVRMRGFKARQTVEEFRQLIQERVPVPDFALQQETIPLASAVGRVLAQTLNSPVNVPAFPRSAMDGYALRSEETFGADSYNPLTFAVIGQVTPGKEFEGTVGTGQAVRIMTGAPIPAGADAVLMAEYAEESGPEEARKITAIEPVTPGKHIGRIGEDITQGQVLFEAGRVLRPQDLGVLASIGMGEVPVVRRPRVVILITGDELLEPGEAPKGPKIVDTNSVVLSAMVERDGGEIAAVLRLPDRREVIANALVNTPCDLMMTTGGTSVGVEDHAPSLVAEAGELLIHGVAMRPSAPTGMGMVQNRPVFLLPGNPVSCMAAYDFFVALALRRMAGRDPGWPYVPQTVQLGERISSQIGRLDYARVQLVDGKAQLLATSGSSILSSTSRADGFVVIGQDSEGFAAGDNVTMWAYDQPLGLF